MKVQHVLRILSVLLLVFVTLAAVRPAYADTHYQIVVPVDDHLLIPGNENPCGFDIEFRDFGTVRVNYWLDENGLLTRELDIYGAMKRTAIANGKTVRGNIQGPIQYEIHENTTIMITLGTAALVTIPGYGLIWGGAGLLIETFTFNPVTGEWDYSLVKQAGNHDYGNLGPFCAYLAP